MTARPSTIPAFKILGVNFVCWVVDDGQRYEWRAPSFNLFAGRNEGRGTYWASHGSRVLGRNFTSLRLAMIAAVQATGRKAA
jgi:hypothetical protein